MNPTTFQPNTGTRALTRTFDVLTVDREFGVVVDVRSNTVTLTRTAAGLIAEIDGQTATMDSAIKLLTQAQRVNLLSEVLMPVEVAAPIGNAVACELHRELGRLGYRAHYQTASEVLGRPVSSLAALSTAERDLVREYAYGQMGLMVGGWVAA